MIVATAGHVDHGKTSLVRALTGVDTDRLPEEKRRGMTIDLGFAYSGALGFVDVPGHERFIHNMLAGVAGIDFALLVVAADDGVMPQTREHLAILDLLGVARGAVALSKIDRVPPSRMDEVRAEIAALLAPTALADAPVFPLSAVTGEGVDALREHLDHEAQALAERRAGSNFRLSVDRCFTIAGAGLVVTGTALSGEVKVGDEVRALLADAGARVRGVHAHNAPAARGQAGQRLALNLSGLKAPIARGDWIVAGNVPPPVRKLDVRLRNTPGETIAHWMPVHVHLGAADVLGRVALLDDAGLAQLVLERPVGAVRGDRFIVRDQTARRTLGGGEVIDVFPPARGRAKPERLAWLRAMEIDDDGRALDALLGVSPVGVDLARYSANRNMRAMSGWRFSAEHHRALREKALAMLAEWHVQHPDSAGLPEERLLSGLRLAPAARRALADEMVHEGASVRQSGALRLASHQPLIADADAALWQRVEPLLGVARPPSLGELAPTIGMEAAKLEAALSRLARQGLVVRVAKNRYFLPAPLKRLQDLAAEMGGPITAAAFRDKSGLGRNVAIEVLEYFDRIKFTRRVGDAHVLLRGRETHPGGAPGLQIR
jgi:selenocysteine-specific elongation factor